jgi:RND family efflux transporter MFP subunit
MNVLLQWILNSRANFTSTCFKAASALKMNLSVVTGGALVLPALIFAAGAAGAEPIVLDGLIEPSLVVNIGSSTIGILESVDADRGDTVRKGQAVASLKSDVEKANLELARYRAAMVAVIEMRQQRLDYSRREKERFAELYNKKALPFSQMDEVETNMITAELELKEALENQRLAELELKRAAAVVERMTIRSPVNGVVVERFLAKGEYVENQPVMKVAQINPLYVEVVATVDMLGAIRLGMRGEVRPEDPVKGVFPAAVTIVDQVVDAASGTFGVRLELPNPEYRLPAGLKCRVTFLEK